MPATSANLGPGFDALGLALARYDEVSVLATESPGLAIDVVGEGTDDVPRDGSHLVVRALRLALERRGASCAGLRLTCVNAIPHGRGLGSSAAAIVAGVLAAAALDGDDETDRDCALRLASEIEGHPDNVAACLFGGLTVAWYDGDVARAVRVDPAAEIAAVVFIPAARLATSVARGLLPDVVPHRDAARSAGRAALLVAALSQRPDLLLPATEDWLHQQYRADAMPASANLLARLRSAAIPAVISGAGPTVLALLAEGPADAPDRVAQLSEVAGPGWLVEVSAVDLIGAQVSGS